MSEEQKSGFSLAKGSTEVLKGKEPDIGYTGVLSGGQTPQQHYDGSIPTSSYRPQHVIEEQDKKNSLASIIPLVIIVVVIFLGLKFLNVI